MPTAEALQRTSSIGCPSMRGGASRNRDTLVARNQAVAGASGGIALYPEHGSHLRASLLDHLVVDRSEGRCNYAACRHLAISHFCEQL